MLFVLDAVVACTGMHEDAGHISASPATLAAKHAPEARGGVTAERKVHTRNAAQRVRLTERSSEVVVGNGGRRLRRGGGSWAAGLGENEGREDAGINQRWARPLLQAHVRLERASKGSWARGTLNAWERWWDR